MKKTAVLLDLGFVLYRLYPLLNHRHATAAEVHAFAGQCVSTDEELFRVYCYHCPPYAETRQHPITRESVDFSDTDPYRRMSTLIEELKRRTGSRFARARFHLRDGR